MYHHHRDHYYVADKNNGVPYQAPTQLDEPAPQVRLVSTASSTLYDRIEPAKVVILVGGCGALTLVHLYMYCPWERGTAHLGQPVARVRGEVPVDEVDLLERSLGSHRWAGVTICDSQKRVLHGVRGVYMMPWMPSHFVGGVKNSVRGDD